MSKRRILTTTADYTGACGELPPWVAPSADLPPRMRCTRPRGHAGKHASAQDHMWRRDSVRPNREARR